MVCGVHATCCPLLTSLTTLGLCFSVPKGVMPPPSLKNVRLSRRSQVERLSESFDRFIPKSRRNTLNSKLPSMGMAYLVNVYASTHKRTEASPPGLPMESFCLIPVSPCVHMPPGRTRIRAGRSLRTTVWTLLTGMEARIWPGTETRQHKSQVGAEG